MKQWWVMFVVAGGALMLSGCNTARGLGADIERLGQIIQGKPKPEQMEVEDSAVSGELEQGEVRYVQPGEPAAYPYQGEQQPAVYPYSSKPVPAAPDAPAEPEKPRLGDVPPGPVNVKEM